MCESLSTYRRRIADPRLYIDQHPDDTATLRASLREMRISSETTDEPPRLFGAGVLFFGHFEGSDVLECRPWAIDPCHEGNLPNSPRHAIIAKEFPPEDIIHVAGFWNAHIWEEADERYGLRVVRYDASTRKVERGAVPPEQLHAVARLTQPTEPLADHTVHVPRAADFIKITNGVVSENRYAE